MLGSDGLLKSLLLSRLLRVSAWCVSLLRHLPALLHVGLRSVLGPALLLRRHPLAAPESACACWSVLLLGLQALQAVQLLPRLLSWDLPELIPQLRPLPLLLACGSPEGSERSLWLLQRFLLALMLPSLKRLLLSRGSAAAPRRWYVHFSAVRPCP